MENDKDFPQKREFNYGCIIIFLFGVAVSGFWLYIINEFFIK